MYSWCICEEGWILHPSILPSWLLSLHLIFKIILNFLYSAGWGFLGVSVVKNPPANAGDESSIPGLGRSPTKGHGNPLWYSCLENPTDRGAWQATVKQLSMHTCRWAWLIYMRSCVCVRQQASRGNNFSMFSFRKEDGTCKPGNSLNVAKWLRRLEASIES